MDFVSVHLRRSIQCLSAAPSLCADPGDCTRDLRAVQECFCLSADVSNAFDPNFAETCDRRNNSALNYGVSICKYSRPLDDQPNVLGRQYVPQIVAPQIGTLYAMHSTCAPTEMPCRTM